MISDAYREQNRLLHQRSAAYGSKGGHKHADTVRDLLKRYEGSTVLDYGCGKGSLRKILGEIVTNYDPATFPELPAAADVVLCSDVLEHIEPEYLDDVLWHLRSLTLKAGFFVIACRLTNQNLPDGSNTHRIVQSPDWWKAKIAERFKIVSERMLDPQEIALTVE